jgi:hypothetical protein
VDLIDLRTEVVDVDQIRRLSLHKQMVRAALLAWPPMLDKQRTNGCGTSLVSIDITASTPDIVLLSQRTQHTDDRKTVLFTQPINCEDTENARVQNRPINTS